MKMSPPLVQLWDSSSRLLIFKGMKEYTSKKKFDDLLIFIWQIQIKYLHEPPRTSLVCAMLTVLSGDVGGQKTLRSYWRNYFEKTDALIWVVDASDRLRIDDCREELAGLLLEEVGGDRSLLPAASENSSMAFRLTEIQRLTGASLLIFSNKIDVEGCMTEDEIREVGLEFRPSHSEKRSRS
jgi:GTPase SAR1 family protein